MTKVGDTRSVSFTDRPPTGFNFVVIEFYILNAGQQEVNTKALWDGEIHNIQYFGLDGRLFDEWYGVEVVGQATNQRVRNIGLNINPESGEQDGCTVSDEPDIPDVWFDGAFNLYLPPGENLPWKPCFVVAEKDLPTLALRWPHFIDGPAIWFALRPDQ